MAVPILAAAPRYTRQSFLTPDDFDRNHARQGATIEFLRQAAHLPGIKAAHGGTGELQPRPTVALTNSLLSESSLHAYTLRLQALLHLALLYCRSESAPHQVELERQQRDRGDILMLVTSFLVEFESKRRDLESRYECRKK